MRIALCDDEKIYRESLETALRTFEALPIDTEIFTFTNGESLIENHLIQPYDIVFLDIEMQGMSGLETGQELRSKDRNVIIIYLTSYKKYVFKSFIIEPFDYILKPIKNEIIHEVLDRAIRKYKEQHYVIDIKYQDKAYALEVCDIVYIESDLRHITIYTKDNIYKSIGKLNEYEHRLSPYGFLRCHQSFLINMSYIKSINSNTIKTTLGSEISMSSRRKQKCLSVYTDFITKYKV
ncbi:MAG: LytTR family DNA-binding domain-containing protein [Oscillospiraceae bacterium]|nr:LytTR family DNA-binding domain-containing protein [Oscillospiraceae bacterium]